MDLPVIGAHCALASCHQLDLLPIRCRCDNQFCSAHIFPDNHDCPVDPSYAPSDRPALDKLQRCAVVACTRPSLDGFVSDAQAGVRARCPRCTLGYCASHRDPAQHACPVPVPQAPPKNAAAHALLAKHFPSSAAAPRKAKTKRPTDPAKLAQLRKVELMKMRQRAAPGNPKDPPGAVPADQRVHVVVRTDEPDVGEKTFWFRKVCCTTRNGCPDC
ncbi:hypothetical protein BV25DRAFT_1827397 [Artomyces pyxidatus]|uniref:Uncharacterized protein n=1 Tax=Artomyces pyxidatus TaxID=48021 RepID=A0ACB8SXF7_9AGAM|nr:hypothetical protein BV25DRAFT_1827397 [Artomyces pyxidatus]